MPPLYLPFSELLVLLEALFREQKYFVSVGGSDELHAFLVVLFHEVHELADLDQFFLTGNILGLADFRVLGLVFDCLHDDVGQQFSVLPNARDQLQSQVVDQ